MKLIIIAFCLIGAVFAVPISYNAVLEADGIDANTTESLSTSQSSENDTSELQSSEESISNQASSSESSSSESESTETTSEDKTSEENDSQSFEDEDASMPETRDNSMGSEENIRKGWVPVFPRVIRVLSAEDNSSTEVKHQQDLLDIKLSEEPPTPASTSTTLRLGTDSNQSSDTSSESAETSSDVTGVRAAINNSSSSESSQSSSSESSQSSESKEDSDVSDSAQLEQVRAKDCRQGADSADCESDEYFFQEIGDDAHRSVEEHRELNLRR
ncbi:secretory calcium-binding phosphoprotein 1 [Genypterus blacodes]|uniref:secretory calcium-binding phosphoprotein 1 n=1 Tax=Genypterus blacodes TaxID=154954 RepID=UPI003F75D354